MSGVSIEFTKFDIILHITFNTVSNYIAYNPILNRIEDSILTVL